jgi:hypothetical protein
MTTINHNRICLVTKVDISMQKRNSRLLSHRGLKHLEKINNNYFKRLKKILLTGEPNKYEKNIYSKIAKQIRNKYYNNYSFYYLNQLKMFGDFNKEL